MGDLPRVFLIADGFSDPAVADAAVAAVGAGVRAVQLRDHAADSLSFRASATGLASRLREVAPEVLLCVNTRLDVAREIGAGVHVGGKGPTVAEARRVLGAEAFVGFSAHDRAEGLRAVQEGADFLFFSPVFPTRSKPGHPGAGLVRLRDVCEAARVPVYALGGVTPERVAACREAGAHGVAVLSGILRAPDARAASQAYLRATSIYPI